MVHTIFLRYYFCAFKGMIHCLIIDLWALRLLRVYTMILFYFFFFFFCRLSTRQRIFMTFLFTSGCGKTDLNTVVIYFELCLIHAKLKISVKSAHLAALPNCVANISHKFFGIFFVRYLEIF